MRVKFLQFFVDSTSLHKTPAVTSGRVMSELPSGEYFTACFSNKQMKQVDVMGCRTKGNLTQPLSWTGVLQSGVWKSTLQNILQTLLCPEHFFSTLGFNPRTNWEV